MFVHTEIHLKSRYDIFHNINHEHNIFSYICAIEKLQENPRKLSSARKSAKSGMGKCAEDSTRVREAGGRRHLRCPNCLTAWILLPGSPLLSVEKAGGGGNLTLAPHFMPPPSLYLLVYK